MDERTPWQSGFLANVSPRVREKVLSLAESFRYEAGKDIFHEGDPSLYLYIVKSGHVAVEVHVPSKGRRTVLSVSPGEVFSWSALVEPRLETAAARASEDTEVFGLKGGALMDLCREDPALGFEIYRSLAEVVTARLIATRLELLEIFSSST